MISQLQAIISSPTTAKLLINPVVLEISSLLPFIEITPPLSVALLKTLSILYWEFLFSILASEKNLFFWQYLHHGKS